MPNDQKTFTDLLDQILNKHDLDKGEMNFAMKSIMQGELTDVQIAAFLAALRCKGETETEIIASVKVMRELSHKITVNSPELLVDTVGCGDGSSTFNISTCCAFVCASMGVPVAKHGNRSNTSACGSSDLLALAGVNLDLSPEKVGQCIEELGVGFLFAPKYHKAMRHAVTARKEMGVRTLFNLLGPLTNPAGTQNQVIGVYSDHWLEMMAKVLQVLGSRHVMVVHARDDIDEISTSAITDVVELKNNQISRWEINPADFSCDHPNLNAIIINSAASSLVMVRDVLSGSCDNQQAVDIIVLNAAAALYVGGKAENYRSAVEAVRKHLMTGEALKKFEQFICLTHSFS